MRKIPTLLVRDPKDRRHVTDEVDPDCAWVFTDPQVVATRKYDGTCVMLDDDGRWWARREVKPGKTPPPGFVEVEYDEKTDKTVGWEPVEQSGFARWHAEAVAPLVEFGALIGQQPLPGTYELIGPKINGNPEHAVHHRLQRHSTATQFESGRDNSVQSIMADVQALADEAGWEGIVWHCPQPDGTVKMAKLKARDIPGSSV